MSSSKFFTMSKNNALQRLATFPRENVSFIFSKKQRMSRLIAHHKGRVVELIGIEPTTSCLQSRRSPS
jgi:hypothetical protein